MRSRNLAIIGASYLQLPLIEKAKEMGYITHVFAWKANDVGESAADYFYPISIVEKEAILKECRRIGICGICSIASDLAIITVNYVAYYLDLTGNNLQTTSCSTNKHLMRLAFEKNGVPSPASILVDATTKPDELKLKYPVIVKPTDRSGSRGIFKLTSAEGLVEAVQAAVEESFEKKALIEEYVEGQEYSAEYISYKKKHYFLALTLKYTTGAPHFIEKGHMEPALLDTQTLTHVQRIVTHALDTLGIENGASHTELKIAPDGKIGLIEVGGRMGGDLIGSDLVRYSTGMDFVRMVIQVACGQEPDFTPVCAPMPVEVVFMFTQEDIDEMERLQRESPELLIKIVDFHPENIGKTTDSSNRVGCYLKRYKYNFNHNLYYEGGKMDTVNMNEWKRIWNAKKANNDLLIGNDFETVFMELKRIDGNDTLGGGGVKYEAFRLQYEKMKKNMQGEGGKIESVFEAGCGSGPFLLMFEAEGISVGGMDYSKNHIEIARKVLKNPVELYCEEAANIFTEKKYDCVYSNSMFEYFSDMNYAENVLDKMCQKARNCIAILDVHDKALESDWLKYRRETIENYDEKYQGLGKLFYTRSFFVDYAVANKMDIKITTSKLKGYWNADFVFDVYLYKNEY